MKHFIVRLFYGKKERLTRQKENGKIRLLCEGRIIFAAQKAKRMTGAVIAREVVATSPSQPPPDQATLKEGVEPPAAVCSH